MNKVLWDADNFSYVVDGEEVDALAAKGASAAVASEANANIRVLSDRLQAGQISLQEWYDGMKRETKMLHMAQAALARGGFEQMRPKDWERVEQIVAAQWNGVEDAFPGLRSFAEDIRNGRYGNAPLSSGVLARAGQYADAGRATYENERLVARMETGPREAKRVRGFADSCRDCIMWAALDWISAEEMLAKYPIGASVCGARCWCVIVTRAATNVAVPVRADADLKDLRDAALRRVSAVIPGVDAPPQRIDTLSPVGRRISQSVRLAFPGRTDLALEDSVKPRLNRTLDVVDAVHRAGGSRIPVARFAPSLSTVEDAEVFYNEAGFVSGGQLSLLGDNPELSLVHEIGHVLDAAVVGAPGVQASVAEHPNLTEWRAAIQASASHTRLRALQKQTHFDYQFGDSTIGPVEIDQKMVSYFLQPQELFARSYSQYVAVRSGDAALLSQVRAITENKRDVFWAEMWDDDDFEAIALAFDRLWIGLGGLK
jgi:hypothetical protein